MIHFFGENFHDYLVGKLVDTLNKLLGKEEAFSFDQVKESNN